MRKSLRRSIQSLGNNKYFKEFAITPNKQSGVVDALKKANQYIKEGKEQIKLGKKILRTGKIPGVNKEYPKEITNKWARDKIRLGKANKLTGVTIYRKIKSRGLSTGGNFIWTGRPWTGLYKGKKVTITRDGIKHGFGTSRGRDFGWGKIITKKPTNPITQRAEQMLRVASGINSRNPSQRKIKVALERQAYKMLNSNSKSAFGEGISRGNVRITTSKLKSSKSIWGSRNTTIRTQMSARRNNRR